MLKHTVTALAFFALLPGCASDQLTGPGRENQPPVVWLSGAPPEGTEAGYTIHMFWGGWDPDGEIAHFEYAITNNETGVFDPADTTGSDKWRRVYRNDSTFAFTADMLADSTSLDPENLKPVRFIRSHTFFIRAVDHLGLPSESAAYRSFTSRTLSPVVDILVPRVTGKNPAQVPPITTYRWIAKDYVNDLREVQEPDSVRWIIVNTERFNKNWTQTIDYVRKNPNAPQWSKWHDYQAPNNEGKSWTTQPLDYGAYIFAVQVKDEAGAVSAVFDEKRNIRRVLVTERTSGPLLTVYNKFIGTIITSSPNTPLTIIDLPPNVPMSFRWSADASSYGGVVSGYRYGWDVQDLNQDSQWAISLTPFITQNNTAECPPRRFQFDSHTFHVEVVDNSGYKSRVGVTVNIIPFTMEKNVLVIDDWKEGDLGFARTNGGLPSDREHDEFWRGLLSEVADFDPQVDMVEVSDKTPLEVAAAYKSIIWVAAAAYNSTTQSVINQVIRFIDPNIPRTGGKIKPNIVSLYMAAGGRVLLCGEQIMTATINRSSFAPVSPAFPIIFRYELTGDQDGEYEDSKVGRGGVGDQSFVYNECCLNVLDIAYIQARQAIRRPGVLACPVSTIRAHVAKEDGLRYAIPMDEKYDFPRLDLRPEVGGPGKWYAEERLALNCDIYNPPYFAGVSMGLGGGRVCNDVAETNPARECFKPIYGNGCRNQSSAIYGAPVAFWTTTFEDSVSDAGGPTGRSAIWGFHPVYFNPDQVKRAMEIVLFDEWELPRRR